MKHTVILYLSTLIVMSVMDMIWIGGIASSFYKSRIGNLEFHIVPAVLFYLMYACGILIFVSGNTDATVQNAALYGALFGLFAYATYDLTNLATLRDWSVLLVVVDIAWGVFTTAAASAAGLFITNYFKT